MAHQTPTEITLANLAGGALMECATAELRRICENIQDPNVKADAKRKLKVEILLEPDETRQMVKVTYQVQAAIPDLFQLGDIVTGESWTGNGRIFTGRFLGWDGDWDGMIEDESAPGTYKSWRVKPKSMRLVEPAPVPNAPALDPQAEKMLKEAQESLAAANRKQAEAVRILGLEGDLLEVAQHRMDDFHSLRAQLAEAVLERDAHKVSLDALNTGRDAMIQERDRLRARVKELEGPQEILGTISITRRGNRLDMHRHMTDKGTSLKRDEFAALVALMVSHASTMAEELAGGEVTEARKS